MTALGRLVFVIFMLTFMVSMFLYIGYNSRDLRYNVQNYVESQAHDPFIK